MELEPIIDDYIELRSQGLSHAEAAAELRAEADEIKFPAALLRRGIAAGSDEWDSGLYG